MAIQFSPSITQRSYSWTNWKTVRSSKNLITQYDDDGVQYTIYGYDEPEVHVCTIYKGTVPDGIISGGYSQAQNDTDKTDFETNFKPSGNKRITRTDQFGNPIMVPFEIALVAGQVPGATAGRVNGYMGAATTAAVIVRAATYAPQASAAQRSIKSANAADAAAGTGARAVTINYLDSNMVLKQDTVTLNGVTAVNTNATDIRFIESMVLATSGTDQTNDGNITLMTGLAGAGSVMAQINALDGATFYAHHYVPAGVTCYILKHTGAGTLAAGKTWLNRSGDPRGTNPLLQVGDIVIHSAGFTEDHDYDVTVPVVGPDLIFAKEQPISAVASNFAFASFDFMQF